MNDPKDKIVGPLREKLPDVEEATSLDDIRWDGATADPTDDFKLEIRATDEQTRQQAAAKLEQAGISVGSQYGRTLKTRATAEQVFDIADVVEVTEIFEEVSPSLHTISEGVGVSNADSVQSNGLTGDGVKAAILDLSPALGGGFWPESHKDYGSQVVDKIQSGSGSTYFQETSEMHGTGCAEIVNDMAPDADLVLAAFDSEDTDGDIPSMLAKLEKQHPDTAVLSISLGSAPTDRLDGLDDVSKELEKFTTEGESVAPDAEITSAAKRGRVCAISAGNAADGNTWYGQFQDDDNGNMVFEDGEAFLEIQNVSSDVFIFVNWDSWDESGQTYSMKLYGDQAKTNELQSNGANSDWMYVRTSSSRSTAYLEITKEAATRDHEFDIWLWGSGPNMQFTKASPERSISIPATTQDSRTLTTAAIQATSFGVEPNAGDLKSYSSRGPTRDDRPGIDIAGPSRVSQTDQGYGKADSTQNPGYGFNGTSAAAPHIAGAATQLFELNGVSHTDVASALESNTQAVPDSNFSSSDTTVVGGGYLDVQAAYQELQAGFDLKWTSNDLGGDPQYNTPAVYSGQVFVGGLQDAFYALSRDDGTSVGWSPDRGNKAGLSDSSAAIWTGESQAVAFFGSGQGDLYAVDTDDATKHWSDQDTPNVGSAITSTPAISNGTVFVGTNDGRVLAWDAATATRQWEQSVDGPVYSELAAGSGLVYVTTANGTLHVLDAADGSEQWKESSFAEFGSSSPTLANGNVYVVADEGYVFEATATKNQLDVTSGFGGTAGSDPVVSNGLVYTGSADGKLYAYSNADGSEQWTFSTGDAIAATPAVDQSNDRIAVPSTDGTLYLLDTSGTQLDAVSIPSGTRASPVIDNGEVFLPTADGTVYAFQ